MTSTPTRTPVRTSANPRAGGGTSGQLGTAAYSQSDWDNECFHHFGEGRDPNPCVACGKTGFFGPRFEEPDRRYRSCRFCGFTQDVDGPPLWYRPVVHGCESWPTCAKAPYIWWVAPGLVSFPCPFCRESGAVTEFLVTAPADDPHHPWWKVPQDRNRAYYARFWENWPVTRGRVYL